MMTLEVPRRLAAGAGMSEQATDAEMWRAVGLSRSGLGRFLRAAQEAVGLVGEVQVLLAGDAALKRLNRGFRGKNKATDVLSFPAYSSAPAVPGMGYGGDLAISLETAERQAEEYGHSLRDEVRVLLLHGVLHLAGMDHEVDGGEMAEREARLRGVLGVKSGLIARVEGGVKAGARYASEKQVPRFARNDRKKGKGKGESKGKGKGESKSKGKGKGESNGNGNGESKSKGKGESKGKGKGESKSKGKGKGKGESNGNGESKSKGKGESKSNGKGESKSKGKGESKSKGKGNGNGKGKGNGLDAKGAKLERKGREVRQERREVEDRGREVRREGKRVVGVRV